MKMTRKEPVLRAILNKKPARHITLVIALTISPNGWGQSGDKPVYGIDNRKEMFESDSALCKIGTAVAALFPASALVMKETGEWQLGQGTTLREAGWCADERFSSQTTGAVCTAFLISDQLVATAGHCINDTDDPHGPGLNCADALFVFDHKIGIDGELSRHYYSTQVYRCQEVIDGEESVTNGDWRVLRLSRSTRRRALPIYTGNSKLPGNAKINIVGHPLGLPMKASTNGSFRAQDNARHFQVNIDAYNGNSGSPVILRYNSHAVVIGLLSGGEQDYEPSARNSECQVSRQCSPETCRGEQVTNARVLEPWADSTATNLAQPALTSKAAETCLWCTDNLTSRQWQCPATAGPGQ